MPRQPDSSRTPRPKRTSATPHPSRASNERQRAVVQAVGTDEEKLHQALSKVDAQTGAAVVSHLGRQVGNSVLHRLLIHAKPVGVVEVEAIRRISVTFGSGARATDFDSSMRAALEAIMRAAGAHSAQVVRVGLKQNASFFDVAVGSVDKQSALESAAAAEVGNRLVCFEGPPKYPAYHFEIHH